MVLITPDPNPTLYNPALAKFQAQGHRATKERVVIGLKREMDRAILRIVPFGEENATTARLIWRQLDLGTIAGVKFKLNRMWMDC